ncbi:hypothetical protein FNW25_05650 [Flavobacterium franklandianum]|uniref:DUF6922 domain-containing protein n=1 Tax=Flavobacterium franklandianum TaxID=2594430 RepID=UPI00117A6D2D|nr:hypothetical protein [Flavobacterium franklandianum]TRX27744.1 hypothetical protein FNW25_05650 [Flavobacterium franklandianum]
MKQSVNIATIFPKHLFWDMDHSKLHLSRDADIIIPRALFATNEEIFATDISILEQFYSKNNILKHLKTTKERISNEVCAMVAKRYNVPIFARFKQL